MPLPKTEHVWTGYFNRSGERMFVITSKEARDFYFLYAIKDGVCTKLGRSRNPLELVEKYRVMETIRGE